MNICKITLSGLAGSGKSTTGKILQEKLGYNFISVGHFSREYALNEFGLNINQFQEKCRLEPGLDEKIDELFRIECNSRPNIIVDYRLGFKFVSQAFHVFLKISDEIGAQRIQKEKRKNEEVDFNSIKERNSKMRQRFIDLYGVDFTDENNYHCVIDTDNLTPYNIADLIINEFNKFNNFQILKIDLSEHELTFLNPFFFYPDNKTKDINDYIETNNKYGWSVSNAEITIDKSDDKIVAYRLLSKKGTVQSRAIKVNTNELEYWRYEFIGRDLEHSPDVFEPSLELFLKFYYQELFELEHLIDYELSLPAAFYEVSDQNKIVTIRYALCVNNLYTKPLFYLSVDDDGFLQSISDFQSTDNKHIVFPTPKSPGNYLLQKFSKNQDGNFYKLENVEHINTNSIIFNGFNKYDVKYFADLTLEPDLIKFGFFIQDLRKIINDADLMLKFIPTVNYHLIKSCNMDCNHCFSDFNEIAINHLEFENAREVIEEISKIKSFRKINFSGGEPTLFKGIELLIKFAKEKGLETSMVTNGYRLIKSPELFDSLIGNLDLLVLSIDSFDKELNKTLGRHVNQNTLSVEDFEFLAKKCSDYMIKIKINTVVTKINVNQLLANDIVKLNPIRWKIFRMLPVENQNEDADNIYPTKEEYDQFININRPVAECLNIKVVAEDNSEMTGSYLMISPDGRFFNNIEGIHNYSDHILDVGIEKALIQTPILREVFYKREGDYSCN